MTRSQLSQLGKTLWDIADCPSSLDVLFSAHTDKFEALKEHKKGLKQQLFPSPEAVGA